MSETGLIASHIPPTLPPPSDPDSSIPAPLPTARLDIKPSPTAFNETQTQLKLGIPLISEKLADEVKRVLKKTDMEEAAAALEEKERVAKAANEAGQGQASTSSIAGAASAENAMDVDPVASTDSPSSLAQPASASTPSSAPPAPSASTSTGAPQTSTSSTSLNLPPIPSFTTPISDPSLPVPTSSDLPPYPVNFRSFDVKREVQKVLDSRKRLKLGAPPTAATTLEESTLSPRWEGADVESRVTLPSVCAYTFHDGGEGVTSVRFSDDSSLVAAGSEESVVRVWSLKGEKLKGMKSDFDASTVRDRELIRLSIHHNISFPETPLY
jgi:hypothetical protein